jgi:hypothetical protein
VLLAAYAVAATEVLGLVHGITQAGLVALWLSPVVILGGLLWRSTRRGAVLRPLRPALPRTLPEWILVAILGTILIATAVVAVTAPPNTWDSLTYHMSRVAHWAQAGSLHHYATGIERQNLMPPGAEIGVLQAYVLAQGDRLVNFPQWLAMAASLVGAAAVARLIGASRLGQLAAGVFVATLPMGIAQATSTMTDYVVAFWVLCVAFETLSLVLQDPSERFELVPLGLAAGLAVLSKPTAIPYLVPFALTVTIVILRRKGLLALLTSTGIAVALVLTVNAGYLGRNLATYGNPLGSAGKVDTHSNEVFNGVVLVSNLIRNASLHAGTPWPAVNDVIYRGTIWIHLKLGARLTDPRTTVHPYFQIHKPAPDETRSGNPLHAAISLALAGILGVIVARGDRRAIIALAYLGLAALCFLLLSSLFKFTVFGSRYHLPFFVLLAPVFGYVVGRMRSPWMAVALGALMLFASRAWLLDLHERPLLPDPMGRSVLTSPRSSLYFILAPGLEEPYLAVVDQLREAACPAVGIMLSGDGAEYPWWPLLGEPRGRTRLEWIVAGTPSARYVDPDFQPCAVICDVSCPGEWTQVRGLPLALDQAGLRLYLSPDR